MKDIMAEFTTLWVKSQTAKNTLYLNNFVPIFIYIFLHFNTFTHQGCIKLLKKSYL